MTLSFSIVNREECQISGLKTATSLKGHARVAALPGNHACWQCLGSAAPASRGHVASFRTAASGKALLCVFLKTFCMLSGALVLVLCWLQGPQRQKTFWRDRCTTELFSCPRTTVNVLGCLSTLHDIACGRSACTHSHRRMSLQPLAPCVDMARFPEPRTTHSSFSCSSV